MKTKDVKILLIEDSPADVRLTLEAFKQGGAVASKIHVLHKGDEAMHYLYEVKQHFSDRKPDLILLDLNLPGKSGLDVLAEIKGDKVLKTIPVVVLTTSASEQDIERCYELHANCYISKPLDFGKFVEVVNSLENFWLSIVKLPYMVA